MAMLSYLKMPWGLQGSTLEGTLIMLNTIFIYVFIKLKPLDYSIVSFSHNKQVGVLLFSVYGMVKAVKLAIQSEPCRCCCCCCWLWVAVGLLFAAPCGNGGAMPVFGLNLLCLLSWKQLDDRHWLSSAGTGVRPSRNSIQGVHVLASDVSLCLPQYWNCIPTFCICTSVYQCFSSCNHHHISCSESLPLFFPLNLIKAILQITEANRPIIRAAGVQKPFKCGRTSSLSCKIM